MPRCWPSLPPYPEWQATLGAPTLNCEAWEYTSVRAISLHTWQQLRVRQLGHEPIEPTNDLNQDVIDELTGDMLTALPPAPLAHRSPEPRTTNAVHKSSAPMGSAYANGWC